MGLCAEGGESAGVVGPAHDDHGAAGRRCPPHQLAVEAHGPVVHQYG